MSPTAAYRAVPAARSRSWAPLALILIGAAFIGVSIARHEPDPMGPAAHAHAGVPAAAVLADTTPTGPTDRPARR